MLVSWMFSANKKGCTESYWTELLDWQLVEKVYYLFLYLLESLIFFFCKYDSD